VEAGVTHVRINSGGGDAFEGAAIYGLLASVEPPVTIEILGVAASAASLIAMAGRPLRMAENAVMMLHRASSAVYGDVDDLESSLQMLRSVDAAMTRVYAARAGVSDEVAGEWLRATTWFGADEALAAHLVDEVFEPSDTVRAEVTLAGKIIPVPEHLRTLESHATEQITCEGSVMKLLLEKLGVAETATEDEALAALAGILGAASVSQVVETPTQDQIAALHAATVQAAVQAAVSAGKVPPACREQAVAACGSTPSQLSAAVAYWEKAPRLTQPTVVVGGTPVPAGKRVLTAAQAKMAKQAGITAEQFLASRYGEVG
jgi:ClpP class serine protease